MRLRVSIGLILVLFAAMAAFADEQFTVVSPEWVAQHANDANVRILDVRPDLPGYFTAHVPNAVYMLDGMLRGPRNGVPVQYLPSATLGDLFSRAGVRDGDTVVVYSEGENVLGATMAAYTLEKIGHPRVALMNGGWTAYKATQKATQQYPVYTPETLTVRENPAIAANLDDVKGALGNPNIKLIDARPYSLYAGETAVWMRNGHIPGAIDIDWHQLTDPANPHQLKSPQEMQAIFDAQGVKKADHIILYCGTSREATLEYMALRHLLGYPNVRLYEGSWTEYSAHPELPIETGGTRR